MQGKLAWVIPPMSRPLFPHLLFVELRIPVWNGRCFAIAIVYKDFLALFNVLICQNNHGETMSWMIGVTEAKSKEREVSHIDKVTKVQR